MLRFRQRVCWTILAIYLFAAFFAVFCLFGDFHSAYITSAADHALEHRVIPPGSTSGSTSATSSSSNHIFNHITDVPFAVWLFLIFVFYAQGFVILLACTKSNPKQFLSTPIFLILNNMHISKMKNEGRSWTEASQISRISPPSLDV